MDQLLPAGLPVELWDASQFVWNPITLQPFQAHQTAQRNGGGMEEEHWADAIEVPAGPSAGSMPLLWTKDVGDSRVVQGSKTHCKRGPMICQVEGCGISLLTQKAYYQRYRVCKEHLKLLSIMVDGIPSRFCQQCGRFQPLSDFDGKRRSCKARLKQHNARRRKRSSMDGSEDGADDDVPDNNVADDTLAMRGKGAKGGERAGGQREPRRRARSARWCSGDSSDDGEGLMEWVEGSPGPKQAKGGRRSAAPAAQQHAGGSGVVDLDSANFTPDPNCSTGLGLYPLEDPTLAGMGGAANGYGAADARVDATAANVSTYAARCGLRDADPCTKLDLGLGGDGDAAPLDAAASGVLQSGILSLPYAAGAQLLSHSPSCSDILDEALALSLPELLPQQQQQQQQQRPGLQQLALGGCQQLLPDDPSSLQQQAAAEVSMRSASSVDVASAGGTGGGGGISAAAGVGSAQQMDVNATSRAHWRRLSASSLMELQMQQQQQQSCAVKGSGGPTADYLTQLMASELDSPAKPLPASRPGAASAAAYQPFMRKASVSDAAGASGLPLATAGLLPGSFLMGQLQRQQQQQSQQPQPQPQQQPQLQAHQQTLQQMYNQLGHGSSISSGGSSSLTDMSLDMAPMLHQNSGLSLGFGPGMVERSLLHGRQAASGMASGASGSSGSAPPARVTTSSMYTSLSGRGLMAVGVPTGGAAAAAARLLQQPQHRQQTVGTPVADSVSHMHTSMLSDTSGLMSSGTQQQQQQKLLGTSILTSVPGPCTTGAASSSIRGSIGSVGGGISGMQQQGLCGFDAARMLVAQGASQAQYRSDDVVVRVSMKIANCRPEQLPPDLAAKLRSVLAIADAHMLQGFMRPGCTLLVLDVAQQQQQQHQEPALQLPVADLVRTLGELLLAGRQVVLQKDEQAWLTIGGVVQQALPAVAVAQNASAAYSYSSDASGSRSAGSTAGADASRSAAYGSNASGPASRSQQAGCSSGGGAATAAELSWVSPAAWVDSCGNAVVYAVGRGLTADHECDEGRSNHAAVAATLTAATTCTSQQLGPGNQERWRCRLLLRFQGGYLPVRAEVVSTHAGEAEAVATGTRLARHSSSCTPATSVSSTAPAYCLYRVHVSSVPNSGLGLLEVEIERGAAANVHATAPTTSPTAATAATTATRLGPWLPLLLLKRGMHESAGNDEAPAGRVDAVAAAAALAAAPAAVAAAPATGGDPVEELLDLQARALSSRPHEAPASLLRPLLLDIGRALDQHQALHAYCDAAIAQHLAEAHQQQQQPAAAAAARSCGSSANGLAAAAAASGESSEAALAADGQARDARCARLALRALGFCSASDLRGCSVLLLSLLWGLGLSAGEMAAAEAEAAVAAAAGAQVTGAATATACTAAATVEQGPAAVTVAPAIVCTAAEAPTGEAGLAVGTAHGTARSHVCRPRPATAAATASWSGSSRALSARSTGCALRRRLQPLLGLLQPPRVLAAVAATTGPGPSPLVAMLLRTAACAAVGR